MKFYKELFLEILTEMDDDSYVSDKRTAILTTRLAIREVITTKPTATEFAIMAAEIFKSNQKIAFYTQNLLELGILVGYMYKEKELAKDASKQRLII